MILSARRLLMTATILSLLAATVMAGPAMAADDEPIAPPPTTDDKKEGKALQDIRDLIEQGQFAPALTRLDAYTSHTPEDANGWNLRGYAARKLGRFKVAKTHYDQALAIDPNHKGALEYLGELYVQTGQLDEARRLLANLNRLCPNGCEQTEDLAAFISGKGETASHK